LEEKVLALPAEGTLGTGFEVVSLCGWVRVVLDEAMGYPRR